MKLQIDVIDLRTGAQVLSRIFESWPVQIGRAKECEFMIPDDHQPELSRRHAWIEEGPSGGLFLLDGDSRTGARSANGTALDGQSLPPGRPAELRDGAVVLLGNRFRLQIHLDAPAEPPATPSAPSAAAPPIVAPSPTTSPPPPPQPVPTPIATPAAPLDLDALVGLVETRVRGRYDATRDLPCAERQRALAAELSAALDTIDADRMADVMREFRRRHARTEPVAAPAPRVVAAPTGVATHVLGRAPRPDESDDVLTGRALLVLDELLEHCVRSIRTRRDFQRELSPEVTQALGRDPNPLMNVRDVADLRRWLFDSSATRTDADLRRVLQSALRRLELHGLGLVAMCEHAPRATLHAVHPDKIEERLSALFSVNPLRGYKAWELYREAVAEYLANGTRLFDAVWPELLRIYRAAHDRPPADPAGSTAPPT